MPNGNCCAIKRIAGIKTIQSKIAVRFMMIDYFFRLDNNEVLNIKQHSICCYYFFEPNCGISIELPLRRTLVLMNRDRHSEERSKGLCVVATWLSFNCVIQL
jgi:hypothetical protein